MNLTFLYSTFLFLKVNISILVTVPKFQRYLLQCHESVGIGEVSHNEYAHYCLASTYVEICMSSTNT